MNIYDPSNYICYVTMDRKFGPAAANGLRDIAYGADTRTRHLVPDSGALVRSSASRRDGRQHCRWGDVRARAYGQRGSSVGYEVTHSHIRSAGNVP